MRQRLPTRLQELVKHYPYNKGSLATEDELLSRPRFSTRQYDALFVRVESLLTYGADQPKQHPIQLLLEAFQLPVENPTGDEHVALWNILKTTASETSSDPEGLQFTRIFVDETVQLLSLIPADNSVPTSPTFLASPITKVVSRKRSSSLTKVLERTTPRSNANNGSTPVSPTSPSSAVITDWAQFSLSGFGETPTTQPLAAVLSQDDDIEVTQPRISRKSSRHRGKSLTRRRRSEDQEPLDTPLSSQSKPEPSIIETKLASVHVIQVDEAFIDFWSDAIVDPISANWPTFVVCGLKQLSGAELPIRWLVIEQIYSHQQPQQPRIPSPEGHRGRSPRPSFRSDISGFRINSMFSSARKRFSVFNKSATDLDPKKSGGRTLIAGELGEVLVEEEPTFPSIPPVKVDRPFDGNAVGATAISGATTNVADQLKVDEKFAGAPPTDLVPVLKVRTCRIGMAGPNVDFSVEESDPVPKTPSVEPTPQSDGFSVPPRSSVSTSEAVSVEQGSPRTVDVVNPKVNAADSVTRIVPLAADTFDIRSTQDTVLPAELAPIAENPVTEEAQAEQIRHVEAEDQLVAQPADGDERLPAESTGDPSNVAEVNVADDSREAAEDVATVAIIHDPAPEHIAEEPQVFEQPSRQAPIEIVAASTGASIGQHVVDDHPSVSAPDVQDKVIVTETGAQLEPDSVTAVVDADEEAAEVADLVDIPTPTPGEIVALVEETPGLEVSVHAYGHAGAAQDPAAEPEAFDDAALQPVTTESQAILRAEEESAAHPDPAEEPSVEIVNAVGTSAEVVAGETEHAAGQVPELATEEAQSLVQDTIVQAAETPLVEANVPAAQDAALVEVEAQAVSESFVSETETRDIGALTPVPENATWVDETPGTEVATEACEPVEVALAVAAESEAVEGEAPEPYPGAKAPSIDTIPLTEDVHIEGELPTRFADTETVVALPTESFGEAATAALATTDDIIAPKAVAPPTPDATTEDAEAHVLTPEGAPVEDILEDVVEASEPAQLAPDTAADAEPVVDDAAEPVIDEAQVVAEDAALSASAPIAVIIEEEPVIDEAQVVVEDAALSASEPAAVIMEEEAVTRDVQVSIEIEEPSSESASQSADEAANAPIVSVFVPGVEARFGPRVDMADGPQEVAEDAEVGVLVEDTEAGEETLAAGPELVSAPAPIVDEAEAPAEAEGPTPVSVEVTDEIVASQPEGKSGLTCTTQVMFNEVATGALAVEIDETV